MILNKIKKMVNNLGIDPDEWFKDPVDPIEPPVGIGTNRYHPDPNFKPEEPPRPEEEIADWFIENPDESDNIEEEKTMHEKMYEIATARYNPFSLGGSENCDSDLDCNIQKHSPWPGGSENFQAKRDK
jgi:hypothetical protein